MNFVGHMAVARQLCVEHQTGDRLDVLLGAALPDVANIAKVKLRFPSASSTVGYGVELHHKTDTVFHRHRWFLDISANLMNQLLALDVPRGAARAVGHVGPELLLDGALLRDSSIADQAIQAFDRIPALREALRSMVEPAASDRWFQTLTNIQKRPPDNGNADPHIVAQRLVRILEHRPRLALAPTYIPVVTAELERVFPQIESDAKWLVNDLANDELLAKNP